MNTWIKELARLAAEATPGPWQERFIVRLFTAARNDPKLFPMNEPSQDYKNAAYIANCTPERIAALIRVAQVAQETNAAIISGYRSDHGYRLYNSLRDLLATT